MGRMKFTVTALDRAEIANPQVLEKARQVVARAQCSVILPGSTMFWKNFNIREPYKGLSSLAVLLLLLSPYFEGSLMAIFGLALAILVLEWVIFYAITTYGFSQFIAQRSMNPIVQAPSIFGGPSNDARNSFFVAKSPSGNICGVALMICGVDSVAWRSDIPAYLVGDDVAIVRFVGVDPACQGSGIGWELMRSIIQRAKDRGCRHVVLHTESLMSGAVRMYLALGFELAERKVIVRAVGYEAYILKLDMRQ